MKSEFSKYPIPPELPQLLKDYTKAALRTQPTDVLAWSAAYFTALAKEEPPPVKRRLELPSEPKSKEGITPGLLRVINSQLDGTETVTRNELKSLWHGVCLSCKDLEYILQEGGLTSERIDWIAFLTCCVALTLSDNILDTLDILCEVLTEVREVDPPGISYEMFREIMDHLAGIYDLHHEVLEDVVEFVQAKAEKQNGLVLPRNFRDSFFPLLTQATG
ncbi:unnamed protein product [Cyprideis torosa]|uniref:Uncharacterized protein n=1 Tax=Cyprideis torosa TaxID=163714 RepID=A0A7R8W2Y3_9CRUS|nr:unnamed protein product [Cyprideis torosa]CAG0879114.1 unnamed protein product [Cyprideis torosa]